MGIIAVSVLPAALYIHMATILFKIALHALRHAWLATLILDAILA